MSKTNMGKNNIKLNQRQNNLLNYSKLNKQLKKKR